jgi:beta-aspartyl-peptidase (threonine type)
MLPVLFWRPEMTRYLFLLSAVSALLAAPASAQSDGLEIPAVGDRPAWVLAIHGGAGVAEREALSPELEASYRAALVDALEAGSAVLSQGGDSVAAIEAAIVVMEESALFNAGRGAALDAHGQARHDASIMSGRDRDAGAVAGSSRIRNPITAARALMERTENVLLHGEGADWFAAEQGLELADPLWFETQARRDAVVGLRQQELDAAGLEADAPRVPNDAFGTVGAVALDQNGDIAAATSTGGRTFKRFGRVGDSPIIGAGTFASNDSCAVSATGDGEYFIRWTVARDICARMEFGGESLEEAAGAVVLETLVEAGGSGAVIAIDPDGEVVFAMNDLGMYRGVVSAGTEPRTGIYADEAVRVLSD